MEFLTHYCYFNALAISGVWQMPSPVGNFIIGYGVLNLKGSNFYSSGASSGFGLWYGRSTCLTFSQLLSIHVRHHLIFMLVLLYQIDRIETQEIMTKCLNNCCDILPRRKDVRSARIRLRPGDSS